MPTIHSAQGGGVLASVLTLFMTAPLRVSGARLAARG